jgi:hypothetical protein
MHAVPLVPYVASIDPTGVKRLTAKSAFDALLTQLLLEPTM